MTYIRTLSVTIESFETTRERSREAMQRALSGDVSEVDAPRRLVFETTDEMARVFSPRAIDLIQAIAEHEPASMREAARLVDRDIKQVSQNLDRLEDHGVVEYVQNGRSKRPVVPWREIDLKLALDRSDDGPAETAGASS